MRLLILSLLVVAGFSVAPAIAENAASVDSPDAVKACPMHKEGKKDGKTCCCKKKDAVAEKEAKVCPHHEKTDKAE